MREDGEQSNRSEKIRDFFSKSNFLKINYFLGVLAIWAISLSCVLAAQTGAVPLPSAHDLAKNSRNAEPPASSTPAVTKVRATDIFVAPGGDDTHSGAIDSPLASLHGARDRIRRMKADNVFPRGGVTVFLRGGDYVLDAIEPDKLLALEKRKPDPVQGSAAAFKLEIEDSGTADSPIIYRSCPGEKATLKRGPNIDFRVSLIMNQADHVFFEDVATSGGRMELLRRPPASRINVASGQPLRLVADGGALAAVVVADNATAIAKFAAQEFVHHVRAASGIELKVLTESEMKKIKEPIRHRVFIGETRAAQECGIVSTDLVPGAFVIKTIGDDLFILGRDLMGNPKDRNNPWVGTASGVYEILERSLGVRWLWPGDLGTYIPRTAVVVVAPVDELSEPVLRYRSWSVKTSLPSTEAVALFLQRHTMSVGARPFFGHMGEGWWGAYGEEHPEWFSLDADGKRKGPTLCVSNPELRQKFVEWRSRPDSPLGNKKYGAWTRGTQWDSFWNGGSTISLCESDWVDFCRCPKCLALDVPAPKDLNISYIYHPRMDRVLADRYADFWRDVAGRAKRVNPEATSAAFLYWQTFHAPLGDVQLDGDFVGEFVPWLGKAMWFPMPDDWLQHVRKQWLDWRHTGLVMGYRPNYFHGGYTLPFLSTWQAGDFFKFVCENGAVGFYGDSLFGQWANKGPMLYMHMRLLKNPNLSIGEIRSEYFSAFGPAAGAVERYFDYWEDFSRRVVEKYSWPKWDLPQLTSAPGIYTPEVFLPAAALLDEALAVAKKDAQPEFAERVRFLGLGLEHARLSMEFLSHIDVDGAVVLNDQKRFEATKAAWNRLRAFREEHKQIPFDAIDQVSNWEKKLKNLDALDKVFAAVKTALLGSSPWSPWMFRADRENRGVNENWQRVDFVAKDWKPVKVPSGWSRTWVSDYTGYGWYRCLFKVPMEWGGEAINLEFGGVDEQAWVYVNGELIGEHTIASTGLTISKLWDQPFTVEIPARVLKPGAENTLVVRVHNAFMDGGIHKPVSGYVPHPEKWRPLPAFNAEEPTDPGKVILSEDFNSLSPGPIAGQGQWTTFPKTVKTSQIPEVVLAESHPGSPSLGLSAALDDGGFNITAAMSPLPGPLNGAETLVIKFDVLRRAGDYVQVGLAKGNNVLPGIDIRGVNFLIRDRGFKIKATSTPIPGETGPLSKYGNWYRIRTTWNGEKGTVCVEYKNLSAGETDFQTAYFDTDRHNPEYQLSGGLGFKGADALFVRLPSAQSINNERIKNPSYKSSILDNIEISKK